jgi:hypothetical protein
MQKIYLNSRESIEALGVTPNKFLYLLDNGRLPTEFIDGQVVFDLHALKASKYMLKRPEDFPESLYATAAESMDILRISRRTFYIRVNQGAIALHKYGRKSFVLRKDLYADNELF